MSYFNQESFVEPKALDEDCQEETFILISSDKKEFTVSLTLLKLSDYIKKVIDIDSTVKEIQLPYIDSIILQKILTWMNYHQNEPSIHIPKPLPSLNLKSIVGKWDAEYIDCDLDTVYKLLLASNFLGIFSLIELCCAKIATLMMGKKPEQIRKTFGIPEEYTEEDETRIQNEFAEYL